MRRYPRNSPEAAARIVAMVMISDGRVSRSELEALQLVQVERALGMTHGGFMQVVDALCEDLLREAHAGGEEECRIDQEALASMMSEVDSPQLQRTVRRLATAVAAADSHLAESEAVVMAAIGRHWSVVDRRTATVPSRPSPQAT
jgi:uncharacterized tellurite resistance protein B-like protein